MLKSIVNFYKISEPRPCNGEPLPEQQRRLKRLQWSTFLVATFGSQLECSEETYRGRGHFL